MIGDLVCWYVVFWKFSFIDVCIFRLQLLMFKYGVASKNSTVHVLVSYLCVSWMLLLWPVRNITDLMTTGTCTTFGRSQWRFIERKKSLPSMRCAKAATRFEWKFCWRRLQVMSSDSWRLWDGVFWHSQLLILLLTSLYCSTIKHFKTIRSLPLTIFCFLMLELMFTVCMLFIKFTDYALLVF